MSVPSWARVGAKVVCIDNKPSPHRALLALNGVYTVRQITAAEDFPKNSGRGMDGITLNEVVNGMSEEVGCEWHYNINRFRPLITRTQAQDVRAIKSMLRELPAETRLDRLLELLE